MSNKVDKRITEQSSLYEHLEKMSVAELTAHINAENKKVAVAIEQALPAINQLISAIEGQLKKDGRLFYAGCGTGGRLATESSSAMNRRKTGHARYHRSAEHLRHRRFTDTGHLPGRHRLPYTNQGIKRRRPGEWLASALRQAYLKA
mgnify:CR=1 FL=1